MVSNILNNNKMNIEKLNDFMRFSIITNRLVIVPYGIGFRWCNNSCEFCYLKAAWDKKIKSIEFFYDIKNKIENTLEDIIKDLPKDIIIELDLTGGELFCLSEEYYNVFYELVDYIHNLCVKYNLKMHMSLSSNLLLNGNQLDRLINLCNYGSNLNVDTDITSSFDLWGRFKNKGAVELWWNNIVKLSETIKNKPRAEMVLLKPSIKIFLNDEDTDTLRIFYKILDNPDKCIFFFENYVPNNPDNIKYVPTNEEKIAVFKKLIDKYYGKLPLLEAFRSDYPIGISTDDDKPRYQDCSSLFYGTEPAPNWGADIKQFDNETPLYNITNCIDRALGIWPKSAINNFKNKGSILKEGTYLGNGYMCLNHLDKVNSFFLNKFGCGACKYKQYCYKNNLRGCYIEHNFIWSDDRCWKKEVFKYMEQKAKELNNE